MHAIHAIIFDFDGTLARLVLDFDDMRRRIGGLAGAFLERDVEPMRMPVLEWLDDLAGRIRGEQGEEMALEFASRGRLLVTAMEMDAAREGELFPFTRPLLDRLKEEGIGRGIITRNGSAAVRLVFPDIEAQCEVFLARDAVARPKPDPLHVRAALEVLGVPPERTLVVGDHPLDIETARAAGTLSGAVATGRNTLEELLQHEPDYAAPDCDRLLRNLGL